MKRASHAGGVGEPSSLEEAVQRELRLAQVFKEEVCVCVCMCVYVSVYVCVFALTCRVPSPLSAVIL